jgi:hypothetical protein
MNGKCHNCESDRICLLCACEVHLETISFQIQKNTRFRNARPVMAEHDTSGATFDSVRDCIAAQINIFDISVHT